MRSLSSLQPLSRSMGLWTVLFVGCSMTLRSLFLVNTEMFCATDDVMLLTKQMNQPLLRQVAKKEAGSDAVAAKQQGGGTESDKYRTLEETGLKRNDTGEHSVHRPQPVDVQERIQRNHPSCTTPQRRVLSVQLPRGDCVAHERFPWSSKCSFSRASSCPDPVWLHDYHASIDLRHPFLSFFVGCNKGIDAVNALRMGSRNPRFDVDQWKRTLMGNNGTFAGSSCAQFDKGQVSVKGNVQKAQVYCFEPVPTTFEELFRAKLELQWNNELILDQAAFSSQQATLVVPKETQLGLESGGIDNFNYACQRNASLCRHIPVFTLDDYVQSLPTDAPIHYLSIDVEGFDYLVLQGGQAVLSQRVHYLEFEYNWKGEWSKHELHDAIDMLQAAGFVCYWPGTEGHIWRITGCWQDHYRLRFWSNVACVNIGIPETQPLAERMERMFLETLAKNETLVL